MRDNEKDATSVDAKIENLVENFKGRDNGLVIKIEDLNNGPDTNWENKPEPGVVIGWKWTF